MRLLVKWIGVPLLTIAMGLFLTEGLTPLGNLGVGIAYARGGGRSAGSSGTASGGMREDTMRGVGMGQGHPGREVGNAVSEAATSTAHGGKQAAQDAGLKNLGGAVSSAVHGAQPEPRLSDGGGRK
jgi:hypothetical protein